MAGYSKQRQGYAIRKHDERTGSCLALAVPVPFSRPKSFAVDSKLPVVTDEREPCVSHRKNKLPIVEPFGSTQNVELAV